MDSRMKTRVLWGSLLVVFATIALYSPSVRYDFINLDDVNYTVDNPVVSGGFSWGSVKAAWITAPVECWAPLLWLSYMLDVELFGLEPWGFHLVNVLLFACNAGLLFWLVGRWTGRWGPALAVALLWALHPARVESVAWIAERKDVLSGLFFLLCLGAYVQSRERGGERAGWAWVALGCFGLGMLVKPTLVMVPFVLLLLDIWPLGRMPVDNVEFCRQMPRLVLEKWRFWLVAFGLGVLSWLGGPDSLQPPWSYRLATIPLNYLTHLWQAVWPVGLSVLCPRPVFSCRALILALAVLGGLTAGAWHLRRHNPAILVGWLWFGIVLVPSIGFFWFGTTEGTGVRFSYLPHVGLMLAAVQVADGFLRWRGWSWRWGASVCLLTASIWAAATTRYLPFWQNSRTAFSRVLQQNPLILAFEGLGTAYFKEGRLAEWQEYVEGFRHKWPRNPTVETYYAWWLAAMLGESEACIGVLEELSGLDSSHPDFWSWIDDQIHGQQLSGLWRDMAGMCLRSRGDLARMESLRARWEGNWDDRTRNLFLEEMQLAYWTAGRDDEAMRVTRELHGGFGPPDISKEILERLIARWQQGGRGYAFIGFRQFAERRPDDGLALNNMAWLLATSAPDDLRHARMEEWPATARAWAERALALGGDDVPGAWDTLAAARANAGDFPGAIAAVERARELARRSGDWTLDGKLQARLAEYRAGQPWREPDERGQAAGSAPIR